jgi:hypothetical protein
MRNAEQFLAAACYELLVHTYGWLADRIPNVTTHFPADQDHTNVEDNNQAAAFAWLTRATGS